MNKHLRAFFSLGLLLVCSGVVVCAQPRSSRTVTLPVVDGHNIHFNHVFLGIGPAHRRVHGIVQDDQGFLWFAILDKLLRFDGYDVREYPHDPKLNDQNLFTWALTKDRSGKLWVARDRGTGIVGAPDGFLDLFDPATEIFTHYPPHDQPFEGPIVITQDRDGVLWSATNQGLFRIDPVTGGTILYQHREDDPASLSANSVRSTLEMKDGTFWVATTKGLDLFDRRTAKVVQHIPLPEDLATANRSDVLLVSLCEDHSGVLWAIFSRGYGLARVDRRAGTLNFYSLDGTGTDNNPQSGAKAIVEDQDGTLWIGTSFSGILKFDRDRTRFVRYRNSPSGPDTLAGDQVQALYEDREGNMWVATNDAGVDRFPARPNPFKHYRHEPDNPNTLDTNYTCSVYEDSRGILWIGSNRALYRIARKGPPGKASLTSVATGRTTLIRKAGGPGELSSTWILSIAEDRGGYLWFGTADGGLNRLDRHTGKFKVYRHDPADPRSLSDNRVQKLFVDHNGVLWAGTDKGLDALDPMTEKFRTYQVSGVNEMRVRDIAEDSQGALWIATGATGLLRLDPVTRQFTVYRHTQQPGNLSSNKAWAVCVDHDGIIWIGTENGLNRFDPVTKTFTSYYESDGLADNRVSHVMEDDRGDLWVSTHNGLSRFNPRQKVFRNYYTSDGLEDNEFYDNSSSWKSPSGEMFLSTNGGLTWVDRVGDRRSWVILARNFSVEN
jgi:ligand-binding sensor domain-containing protein